MADDVSRILHSILSDLKFAIIPDINTVGECRVDARMAA